MNMFGFGIHKARGTDTIMMPYWFLVLLSAVFAAAPWIRHQFSLRTLLIATTLIAVLLGLIVWLVR